jgi:prolyl 4-hydroxylase
MMSSSPIDLVQQAEALARNGNAAAGRALLEKSADNGDALACFALARWHLSGAFIQRSLERSRSCFARAAELGHADSAQILNGFLATGTGGVRDWPAAMELLEKRAAENAVAQRELALIQAMALTPDGDTGMTWQGEVLNETPHLTVFKQLLTPEESRFLIDVATPVFAPSTVVDPATGQLIRNPIRTSDVAGFPLVSEGPAISAINRRIASCSGTSASQGEPLQVLRYRPGQQYRAHFDGLANVENQRVMTMLIYLNDDYTGGETVFPKAGLSFRGEPGDALLFSNVLADGALDEMSLHAGLPVERGEKLLASRWIRARPLDLSVQPRA